MKTTLAALIALILAACGEPPPSRTTPVMTTPVMTPIAETPHNMYTGGKAISQVCSGSRLLIVVDGIRSTALAVVENAAECR